MRTVLAHLLYCAVLLPAFFFASTGPAVAAVGFSRLIAADDDAVITIFYPSSDAETTHQRGRFAFDAALDGAVIAGNSRLVIISHGSGGSPWPHADLARTLVQAGFVVAFADHLGDNWRSSRLAGPWSWKLRPAQVTQVIDRVAAAPRFADILLLDRVGVYGMSAGGLTALILAGASWSPAAFAEHCRAHIAADFPACVGLYSSLSGGGFFDSLRIAIARWIIVMLFTDDTSYRHHDARIAAVVAAVPSAAVIDPSSVKAPAIPIGLIEAGRDAWLAPEFHVRAISRACHPCTLLAELPDGGHASVLSPWPGPDSERERILMSDPIEFKRSDVPAVYHAIANFFIGHLIKPALKSN